MWESGHASLDKFAVSSNMLFIYTKLLTNWVVQWWSFLSNSDELGRVWNVLFPGQLLQQDHFPKIAMDQCVPIWTLRLEDPGRATLWLEFLCKYELKNHFFGFYIFYPMFQSFGWAHKTSRFPYIYGIGVDSKLYKMMWVMMNVFMDCQTRILLVVSGVENSWSPRLLWL